MLFLIVAGLVNLIVIAVTLKFMWDVRHSRDSV